MSDSRSDSRFPPTPTKDLPQAYQGYGSELYEFVGEVFGENGKLLKYRDEKDALIGPFPILISSKEVGKQFINLNKSFSSLEGLPEDCREVVILTIGAVYQAAYELYAHKSVAVNSKLLSQEQVDSISSGKKPSDLNDNCSVAYDCVYHLGNKPGPLPSELFEKAVKAFGKDGTLLMSHYAGIYAYTSILLNVADASAPKE